MPKMVDPNKPSPAALQALMQIYEHLKTVRASKTVSLKPCAMIRKEIIGFDGNPQPFNLRYYQVQGIYHLITMKRMVLGDGTGIGKCLTGGTLLDTDQGLLPIRGLAPPITKDDTFYPLRNPITVGIGGSVRAPLARFYWNGNAETRQVTTHSGFRIEGSLVHPILIRNSQGQDFCELPHLTTHADYACIVRGGTPFPSEEPAVSFDYVLHQNAEVYTCPPRMTPDLARLLGYIVAEAWTNGKYCTSITQHCDVNPESHADIRGLLLSVFGWDGDVGNALRDISIPVTIIQIRKYLEACGVTYTTAHHKEVPWIILRSTVASVREFLRGLFEGEASVGKGCLEFSSSSESLARVTQLLLLRFGIISVLAPRHIKGYEHTYWRLGISGEDAQIFADEIGFVSSRKMDTLRNTLSEQKNSNKDVVPYMSAPIAALKAALMGVITRTGANSLRRGSGCKQFGESFQSTLKHIIHKRRNPTYPFLRRFLDIARSFSLQDHPAFRDVQKIVSDHFFYDPIARVETGRAPLMDVEVADPSHQFSANGFVNHNTCQAVCAMAYLWSDREPDNKVIVVAPKSALRQWASEIHRFVSGVTTFVASGGFKERSATYEAWAKHAGPSVLILNYAILLRDWDEGGVQPMLPNGHPDIHGLVTPGFLDKLTNGMPLLTIFDECHAFKSTKTKTWQTCKFLSDRSRRCYGLTATLLKNNLIEGFSIYKVIYSPAFTTKTQFLEDFCITKMQSVGGRRQIPIIKGYKNLDQFRARIDPYFLGRPKHAVSDELPTLITKEVACELSSTEDSKYEEALSGVIELGDGETRDFEDHKAFVSLLYCQQVVNSMALLKFGDSKELNLGAKEEALVDLLTGELEDEKVVIYTRFESHIARLQQILKAVKIKSVRLTGKEKDKDRSHAQSIFQDMDSDTRVILITAAGTEAINLQAASAMIFFDAPWSWGDYVQGIGRLIRIGSPHQHVVVYHLVAERPKGTRKNKRKTIDHYTLGLLRGKRDLIDRVLGESAVGALDFEKGDNFVRSLIRELKRKDVPVTQNLDDIILP